MLTLWPLPPCIRPPPGLGLAFKLSRARTTIVSTAPSVSRCGSLWLFDLDHQSHSYHGCAYPWCRNLHHSVSCISTARYLWTIPLATRTVSSAQPFARSSTPATLRLGLRAGSTCTTSTSPPIDACTFATCMKRWAMQLPALAFEPTDRSTLPTQADTSQCFNGNLHAQFLRRMSLWCRSAVQHAR